MTLYIFLQKQNKILILTLNWIVLLVKKFKEHYETNYRSLPNKDLLTNIYLYKDKEMPERQTYRRTDTDKETYTHTHTYTNTHHTHTHTHTHTQIHHPPRSLSLSLYIYIYTKR